jgi:hypothetical protein
MFSPRDAAKQKKKRKGKFWINTAMPDKSSGQAFPAL